MSGAGGGAVAMLAGTAPVTRRVRAYFAPVERAVGKPTIFDPAQVGEFALDLPPAPWVDLGWCTGFSRKSGAKIAELKTGAPAVTQVQARTELEATIQLDFEQWGKLQLALSAGAEQMNLLVTAAGASANGSGGLAAGAVPLVSGTGGPAGGSSATQLNVGAAAATTFSVGDMVAVDADYMGQIGFVGAGVSAAYVTAAANVGNDLHYIRRVTLNVGRVTAISGGVLTLGGTLLAGAPVAGMQVCKLVGFVDREGGSFFQEWSGLFCADGEQGDRMLFFYPRLQSVQNAMETTEVLSAPLERVRLRGSFRALPVTDANDGAQVLCFRSYLPARLRSI